MIQTFFENANVFSVGLLLPGRFFLDSGVFLGVFSWIPPQVSGTSANGQWRTHGNLRYPAVSMSATFMELRKMPKAVLITGTKPGHKFRFAVLLNMTYSILYCGE